MLSTMNIIPAIDQNIVNSLAVDKSGRWKVFDDLDAVFTQRRVREGHFRGAVHQPRDLTATPDWVLWKRTLILLY
jgi:hypothetical protein